MVSVIDEQEALIKALLNRLCEQGEGSEIILKDEEYNELLNSKTYIVVRRDYEGRMRSYSIEGGQT